MSEIEISDNVSIAEDEQHYIDEYYDETEDKLDSKFEEFLKNRIPPTVPEKIEDLMTKQEIMKKKQEEQDKWAGFKTSGPYQRTEEREEDSCIK